MLSDVIVLTTTVVLTPFLVQDIRELFTEVIGGVSGTLGIATWLLTIFLVLLVMLMVLGAVGILAEMIRGDDYTAPTVAMALSA